MGNRVSHGIRYSGMGTDSAALAYAFHAEGVKVGRRHEMTDFNRW